MLRALVELSLRARVAVIALSALVLAYGIYTAQHARLDVLPDFAPPQATVQTEAPGLSAEQVENLVTRPLEAAMQGAVGLESLRSQSIQGLSVITAIFRSGIDPRAARQVLFEELAQASRDLPATVHSPKLAPLTSATMDLLKIGLRSERLTPMELRTFAQWVVRPRLQA